MCARSSAGHDAGWQGKLVTDDFSGYKACFELGVTEVGCMAHARRKFHELWANHGSQVGEQALKFFVVGSGERDGNNGNHAAASCRMCSPWQRTPALRCTAWNWLLC